MKRKASQTKVPLVLIAGIGKEILDHTQKLSSGHNFGVYIHWSYIDPYTYTYLKIINFILKSRVSHQ